MKRLFATVVTAGALLLGSATCQDGFAYPYLYGYPYGYDPMMLGTVHPDAMAGGLGYSDPALSMGSYDAYFADLLRQGDEQLAAIQQSQAQMNAYVEQAMAQINQYFIALYRSTTGDQASSDETALYYGQAIHCQQYPVDCEIAARNAQARAAAASAGYDAANDAWRQEQARKDQAHEDFIRTVIREEAVYTSSSGGTQILPFAPSQTSYYQTPAGLPLVFDAGTDTWYQIEGNGAYTPYYGGS